MILTDIYIKVRILGIKKIDRVDMMRRNKEINIKNLFRRRVEEEIRIQFGPLNGLLNRKKLPSHLNSQINLN